MKGKIIIDFKKVAGKEISEFNGDRVVLQTFERLLKKYAQATQDYFKKDKIDCDVTWGVSYD